MIGQFQCRVFCCSDVRAEPGHGSQHGQELLLPGLAPLDTGDPARGHAGARQRRQDHSPLPPQVRPVPQHGADHRVQLREGQRDSGEGEGDKFPSVGRRRAGEAAAAVEVVHQVHGRDSVCVRLCGRGEDGGGEDGVGEDG